MQQKPETEQKDEAPAKAAPPKSKHDLMADEVRVILDKYDVPGIFATPLPKGQMMFFAHNVGPGAALDISLGLTQSFMSQLNVHRQNSMAAAMMTKTTAPEKTKVN